MGPLTRERSLCTLETCLWGQLRTQHQKQTIRTTLFGPILGQILLPITFTYFRVIYYEDRELPTSPHLHPQSLRKLPECVKGAKRAKGRFLWKFNCVNFSKVQRQTPGHPHKCPSNLLPTRTLGNQNQNHVLSRPG